MITAVVKEAIALKAMTKYSFPPHTVKYSGQFVTLLYKTKSKIPNNENYELIVYPYFGAIISLLILFIVFILHTKTRYVMKVINRLIW